MNVPKKKKGRLRKRVDIVEVKKFLGDDITTGKNKYLRYTVFSVLCFVSVFMFYSYFMDKDDEIYRLNKQIAQYEGMMVKQKEDIKQYEEELSFLNFKDFYYIVKDGYIDKILGFVWRYSKINNVNPYHVLLIISVESNFNQRAKSNAGAYGLMQIHFVSWKKKYNIKTPEELYDIEFNIRLGCEIFKYFFDTTDGDLPKAFLMYNSGNMNFQNREYVELMLRNKFFKGF